eukprot:SAG11_NODE_10493_length_827_cov_3.504121_1_plen_112_part_00
MAPTDICKWESELESRPTKSPQAFEKDSYNGQPFCIVCKQSGHTANRCPQLRNRRQGNGQRASNYALRARPIHNPDGDNPIMAPAITRSAAKKMDTDDGIEIDPRDNLDQR